MDVVPSKGRLQESLIVEVVVAPIPVLPEFFDLCLDLTVMASSKVEWN